MKISLLGRSLLLAAAVSPGLGAAPPNSPPPAKPAVVMNTPRRIANGMTRAEVLTAAGEPGAMLDANVWAYWSFIAQGVPETAALDTLLVVFKDERVIFFKFVAAEPVRRFLARQKPTSGSPKDFAAK